MYILMYLFVLFILVFPLAYSAVSLLSKDVSIYGNCLSKKWLIFTQIIGWLFLFISFAFAVFFLYYLI